MLESYQVRNFSAPTNQGHVITHDVYTKGDTSACIVIIQELPGIGPETISLAETFAERGFRVVLPHLFGPLGRVSLIGNVARVLCMRREFTLFSKNKSSPVVDWLRALCRDLKDNHGASGVGVIGMCLTGNFAISLMADDAVLAGVASQPSMPLFDQDSLHMDAQEVADVRARLDQEGPMMALRFKEDPLCTGAKFAAIGQAFNDDKERIKLVELPGKGHSVLTLDLIKGGQPAQQALDEVIGYFSTKLKTA
jgi:dienelactone hydrolase